MAAGAGLRLWRRAAILRRAAGRGLAEPHADARAVYSSDGGGRSTDGGLEFWDVSNPRTPLLVQRYDNEDTHGLREAHGFAFSTSYPYDVFAVQSEKVLLSGHKD